MFSDVNDLVSHLIERDVHFNNLFCGGDDRTILRRALGLDPKLPDDELSALLQTHYEHKEATGQEISTEAHEFGNKARLLRELRRNPSQPVGVSGRRFHLISAVDIAAKAGSTSWLIKNYLELNSLIQVFAPPKSYKSFLALNWGLSIATGRD